MRLIRFTTVCSLFFIPMHFIFAQVGQWQQSNGPYGGYIQDVVYHPSGSLVAGSDFAGLFHSTDFGTSWSHYESDSAYKMMDVEDLLLLTNGNLVAATMGQGIIHSTDGGANWSDASSGLVDMYLNSITEDSLGSLYAASLDRTHESRDGGLTWRRRGSIHGVVYALAAAPNGELFAATDSGVYRSPDNASTWIRASNGITTLYARTLAVHPSGTLYVGTADQGVFKSTDNANTWTWVSDGLVSHSVRALIFDASLNLFAATSSGVFFSSDEGSNWTARGTGLPYPSLKSLTTNGTNRLFAGTEYYGVYTTEDAGTSWLERNSGLTALRAMFMHALQDGTILLGVDGRGVMASTDHGLSWSQHSNSTLFDRFVTSLFVKADGELFLTTIFRIFRSIDGGANWILTGYPIDLNSAAVQSVAQHANGNLFATAIGGVYRSTNNGGTWTRQSAGLPILAIAQSILMLPNGDILIGTQGNGMYRSSNLGASWVHSSAGSANASIKWFLFGNTSEIFASGYAGILYKSADNGLNWSVVNTQLPPAGNSIRSIAKDISGTFYAATALDGVYRSIDSGTSWQPFNTNLTIRDVALVAVDPLGFLVAGVSGGPGFRTSIPVDPLPIQLSSFGAHTVGGNSVRIEWATQTELNNYGFEIQKSRNDINAYQTIDSSFVAGNGTTLTPHSYSWNDISASSGRWFYRLKQIDLDGSVHYFDGVQVDVVTSLTQTSTPSEYILRQNFPNPFNPTTTIAFDLPERSHVKVTLLDALGRNVETLMDRVQNAGRFEIRFDASHVASGTYFYRLEAGPAFITKKMVLLK